MPTDRVLLTSIKTLTFYAGEVTAARRTTPIPQLTCVGKACNLYKPDAVQCYNMGGSGTDVHWKCEADLPESLRFGRVDVSCEGWSKAGDPYVLKGSCGLEYRLVQLDSRVRATPPSSSSGSWFGSPSLAKTFFWLVFLGVLLYILYSFFFPSRPSASSNTARRPPRPPTSPFTNWFTGGNDATDPPPPYPGHQPPPKPSGSSNAAGGGGWRPGFWTGLGLGGLAASMYGARQRRPAPQEYDWERERARPGPGWGWGLDREEEMRRSPPRRSAYMEDRGPASAGPSRSGGLGEMRRSTGVGGSNVR